MKRAAWVTSILFGALLATGCVPWGKDQGGGDVSPQEQGGAAGGAGGAGSGMGGTGGAGGSSSGSGGGSGSR